MLFLQTTAPAQNSGFDLTTLLLPALFVVMIFFLFRSNKKRKAQAAELQTKMAPGVQVMTNFGLFGELVSVDDERNEALIEVSPGTVVRVHRQVLARVVEDEATDEDAPIAADDAGDTPGEPRDRA